MMRPYLVGFRVISATASVPSEAADTSWPGFAEVLDQQVAHVGLVVDDENMEGSVNRLWHGDCSTLGPLRHYGSRQIGRNLERSGRLVVADSAMAIIPPSPPAARGSKDAQPASSQDFMPGRTQPCVLVVDDDDDLREVIAEHLTSEGFVVAQAPTGADALDRLKGFAYDGLVIDLKLPDANGLDILDAAMTRYPEVVAVVMTGFGGVEDAVAAIKRGAIDFFIKPVQLAAPVPRAGGGHQRAAPAPGERRTARAASRSLPVRQRRSARARRCRLSSRASSWSRR